MRHAWLIDVLTDLRGFAQDEGFDRLAAQFDDALVVAAGELATDRDECDRAARGTVARAGHRPADLFEPSCGGGKRH